MGTFIFKWCVPGTTPTCKSNSTNREHPASDVCVTGTFDNWSESEKLVKKGDIFEKEVSLSPESVVDKIYYKVRGLPQEAEGSMLRHLPIFGRRKSKCLSQPKQGKRNTWKRAPQ